MTERRRLAIVAGAGPGLGAALMRRFDAGGYAAVGFSRTPDTGMAGMDIRAIDLTDPDQVHEALHALITDHGAPKIVVHNPAQLVINSLEKTTIADFEACWRSMALSAAVLAQTVIPVMVRAGGGAFIVSGATASLRGGARFAAFASAKFALRGLTQSLAREFQSSGVHVAHVILDGIIDSTASRALHSLDPCHMMQAADIAEAYWQIAHQPRSAWSHEVDLRPSFENF
jgi:NAD(P)-dependent dehydrogenase (short-subunit alcohol dehydrogenase family)